MEMLLHKHRSLVMSTSFAIVVAASTPVSQLLPGLSSFEGTCRISIGSMGGQRFATLKCQKANKPGVDIITGTYWENRSKKEFDDLAKFSGRRLICKFQKSHTSYQGDEVVETYKITDCR